MHDAGAQLARGYVEVVDIRRLVDRGGQRFVVSLLLDVGDDQHRADGVVVRAGSRGEREAWFQTVDPGTGAPCMMRAPSEFADVVVQLVLGRAESAMLFYQPRGAS